MVQLFVYLSVCQSAWPKRLTNHPTDRLTNWLSIDPTVHLTTDPPTKLSDWLNFCKYYISIFMNTACDKCYDYNQPSVAPSHHSEPTINMFNGQVSWYRVYLINAPCKYPAWDHARTHTRTHTLTHARRDTSQHHYHGRWTHPFWKLIKINF